MQVSRSLPAIGMKQTSKRRVSIFFVNILLLVSANLLIVYTQPSLFDHYIPKEELLAAKQEEVIDATVLTAWMR